MTDKEKARAYDEALSKCKAYIDDTEKRWSEEFSRATEEVFKEIFPELRESEDERIRKFIYDYIADSYWMKDWNVSQEECLAYLEKQKEQKPVEIHIDNPNIQKVDPDVKISTSDSSASGDELLYVNNKSYRLGYQDGKREAGQKLAEWSEEDKRKLNRIYEILGYAADDKGFLTSKRIIGDKEAIELQDFLKSLRPSWKPSEEQEVDLEKETRRWWKEHLHLNTENQLWMDAHQSVVFARHFYELGKDSK